MTNNEKLNAFTSAVLSDAKAEAERVAAETAEEEKKALEEFEASTSAEAERKKAAGAAAAKAREEKRVAAGSLRSRRTLLELREKCSREVYDEVRHRVETYPASEKYPDWLAALLKKALDSIPGIGRAGVLLRPEDMRYKETLAASVPGMELEFRPGTFHLGGLIVRSDEKARRIDMTLDSAMEDIEGRFSELTGFRVED